MGWLENLLNEIPLTTHYRHDLEAMQKENAALKEENAMLKSQLEALRTRGASPDRLDDEMEKVLLFILEEDYATVSQMSQELSLSRQVLEMLLEDLMKLGYIEPSYAAGDDAQYYLKQKAKRYLHSFGLL
jgi:DNA-binding MarR family transcriptional regulator